MLSNRITDSEMVQALVSTVDAKDEYTNGHSNRVADYSVMLAKELGKSKQEQELIYDMALLHDIGKVGIPDRVLKKPARLTDEEYKLIKEHTVIGAGILENVKSLPHLGDGARWHHERYDGTGYPDGLKGSEIPEYARIICVADAYDAMTSIRAYSDIRPQKTVRHEIEKGAGSQFDPAIAEAMLRLIDRDTDYRMHG